MCDTLHAHTQVLGKLAATAPPSRAPARGAWAWSSRVGDPTARSSGRVRRVWRRARPVLARGIARASDGRVAHVPLSRDRSVGTVTRDFAAVRKLVGGVEFDPAPQETPWQTPLDKDQEHATYDPRRVRRSFARAATRAALVLGGLRAPYRGPRRPSILVGIVRPRRPALLHQHARPTPGRCPEMKPGGQRSAVAAADAAVNQFSALWLGPKGVIGTSADTGPVANEIGKGQSGS